MRIKATYQIEYDNGMKQVKNLISHKDYEEIIVKKRQEIIDLWTTISKTEDKNHKKYLESKVKEKEDYIKELFGEEWFTDKSPLYQGLETGYLEIFGGTKSKIKFKKV